MRRQLRAKGGITDVVQRTNYLFGGIKDRIRKLIPNEIADVAVKAAPLVAPFSPKTAALMRGIGRFDQRGSISDALKQGAATFAFGSGARKLGGAENVFGDFSLSSPLNEGRTKAIGSLFEKQKADPSKAKKDTSGILPKKVVEATAGKIPGVRALPKIVQEQLLVGTLTSGASTLYSYFQGDFREQKPDETMEDYLAARKEYVGTQMRTYMDDYFKFDPEYSALDDAGRDAFVARYNVKDGGRIEYQTGGISSVNTLAENIARNRAAQAAFQQSIAPAQQRIRQKISRSDGLGDYVGSADLSRGTENINSPLNIAKAAASVPFNFIKGAIGNPLNPGGLTQVSLTQAQKQRLNEIAKAKGTATGNIDYSDYGSPTPTFSGVKGMTPLDATLATTMGGTDFRTNPDGKIEFLGGKYDFNKDFFLTDFIDQGGISGAVARGVEGIGNLLTPSTAMAAETTPTPDAGTDRPTMADVAGPSRETIIQRILKEIEPGFKEGSGVAAAYPDQYKTGLNLDYLKTLDPDEIKLRLDNAYLQGEGFENPDFSRGRIGGGRPFFRYGPEYMKDFNMAGGPLQLSDQYTGYNLRNELGQLESILGKETIKPYQTKVEDALIDLYRNRYSGDSDLQQRIFGLASGGMPTGIMRSNQAGVMERDYRDKGGFVPVGIKEKADDVPAMLSKNEFVMTANAVRGAGNGSIEKGAQRMYDTMKRLEKRAR